MPYIKSIASITGKADNGGGGSKKAGLVYGSDWRRIPRSVLMTGTTNTILDCMLQNCRKISAGKDSAGNQLYEIIYMPFTKTYINKRGRNNTV
jgi:hypothetical protein